MEGASSNGQHPFRIGFRTSIITVFVAVVLLVGLLWVPLNITVREKVPDAVKLVDASAYYPQSAVVGGWVARRDFHEANKDVLVRIIRGWADANDYIVRNGAAAAEALKKNHYPQATTADVAEALKAQKMFSSREWKRLYSDGTVVKWLQQVSDFFMADAGATGWIPARDYFDPTLYLGTIS